VKKVSNDRKNGSVASDGDNSDPYGMMPRWCSSDERMNRFAEIWLTLIFMMICYEKKTLFVC
jgi:hypothetical protein